AVPNVVLILADDLGWRDLGCQGSSFYSTPRIDRLARSGMRFTNAYAMSVCSPSRAMLMTGRHAARLGMTIWIEASGTPQTDGPLLGAESIHDLPRSEVTLATRFRQAGYLTASVGKWHLGDAAHSPEVHGFDINVGGNHWGAPMTYFWPYRGSGRFGPDYRYVPHLDIGEPGEYLTDRLTDEAIRVIDHAQQRQQPFFLLLSHFAPHTPIEAKPEDIEYFEDRMPRFFGEQSHPVYAAMLRTLDQSVGRVLDRLRELGIDDNTVVIFTSDNGGFTGVEPQSGYSMPVTRNAPLRSGKGSLYEGGIRVPLIIRWPRKTRPRSRCAEPVWLADLFPTLVEGLSLGPQAEDDPWNELDGIDLTPLLHFPKIGLDRTALHFHYPHYYPTTTPAGAIREGDWKLIEFFEDGRTELYNLAADIGETSNQAVARPDVAGDLRRKLESWRRRVGAKLPEANPDHR
ncbi:MAG: hypothetical protein EA381_18655, partial [Planctomycetaceae bacterium]